MMHELDGVKKIKDFGEKIGGARKDMYNGRRGSKGKEKTIYEGYYTPQPELSEIKDWNFKLTDIKSQCDLDKIAEMYDRLSGDEQVERHSAGFYNLLAILRDYVDANDDLTEEKKEKYAELLEKIGAGTTWDFADKTREDKAVWDEMLRKEIGIQEVSGYKTIELSEIVNNCIDALTPCNTYGFLYGYHYESGSHTIYNFKSFNDLLGEKTVKIHCEEECCRAQYFGFLEWMKVVFNRKGEYPILKVRETPLHFTIHELSSEDKRDILYIFEHTMLTNCSQLNIYSDDDLTALKETGYPTRFINTLSLLSYKLTEPDYRKNPEYITYIIANHYLPKIKQGNNCAYEQMVKVTNKINDLIEGCNKLYNQNGKPIVTFRVFDPAELLTISLNKRKIIPYGYMTYTDRGIPRWYRRYEKENHVYYWRKCQSPFKDEELEEGEAKYFTFGVSWRVNNIWLRFANRSGKSFLLDETSIPLESGYGKYSPIRDDLNLSKQSLLPKFDFHFSFLLYPTNDGIEIYAIKGVKTMKSIRPLHPSVIKVVEIENLEYIINFDNWVAILNKAYSMLSGYDERKGDCRYRKGLSWRDESKDVTEDDFIKVFGFRGVEFGNYVTGTERHVHMNATFDAFCDMAAMLGIPRKLVSLNGTLALAFGSRGQGGRGSFAAHYESDYKVINLTRPNGAGSLAHEWWHAFDNYVGEWIKNHNVSRTYFTELKPFYTHVSFENIPYKYNMSHCDIATKRECNWEWLSRSNRLNYIIGKSDKKYWTRPTEVGARCFETYMQYSLAEYGYKNDYLCGEHYKSPYYPYPIFKTDKNFDKEDTDVDKVVEYFESVFSSELLSDFFGMHIEVNRKSKQELEKEHGVTESMMEGKEKKKEAENKNKADNEEEDDMEYWEAELQLALALQKMKKIDWANIPID